MVAMDDAAGGGTSGVDGHAEGVGGQVGSLGRIDGPANHAPGPDAGDDAAVHLSLTPQEADLLRSLDRGLHGLTALDALREGYEVYPIVDAIGGTSLEAHRAGLERVVQAGGQPISWVSLACELQRDQERVACLRLCVAATI